MKKLYQIVLLCVVSLCCHNSWGQSPNQKLCNVFTSSEVVILQNGVLTSDTTYNPSNSTWEIDWDETNVFHKLIKYTNNTPSRSFELRLGKGGQIYSFKNDGFGEAMPPQWRPSFDDAGNNIADPGIQNPILSNHGNWAPWNDEVWQFVGSDQLDLLDGKIKTRNIHQAGSYMNNNSHRVSDHIGKPFYSPMIQSFSNNEDGSFTGVYWGQSEDPSYVYDPWHDCDVCVSDPFKPSVIVYNKLTNLGDGVIQVDFLLYNYHRTRGIDYWNVPFMGIRNSSLPYAFVSNSTTDPATYTVLNTKAGHPVPGDDASYLPEFKDGAIVKTSGRTSTSSGWFAFSKKPDGNGPSLGLVTANNTSSPTNGYGDFRYGTAMSNSTRDVTILTRRAIGGAKDPVTGFKPWGIVAGQSIRGRYFIVVDSSINSLVDQIKERGLSSQASIEKVQIDSLPENNVYYNVTLSGSDGYTVIETDSSSASIRLNSQPFDGSYPLFLLSTNSMSVLTSDPYYFSDRPYDGDVRNIELLGFSSSPKEELITGVDETISSGTVNVYPNPTTGTVTVNSNSAELDYINVFNYLGQNVTYRTKIERVEDNRVVFDLSNLETGLYIIKTRTTSSAVYNK